MRLVSQSVGLCHQRQNRCVIIVNSTTRVCTNEILFTAEDEIIINTLTLITYCGISVYLYKDLPSIYSTQTMLRFDGQFIFIQIIKTNILEK